MGQATKSKWLHIFVASLVLLTYSFHESTTEGVSAQEDQETDHPYEELNQEVDIWQNNQVIGQAILGPMDHNEITYCIEKEYFDGQKEELTDERYNEFKEAVESALKQWEDVGICLDKKAIKFTEVSCDNKPDLVFKPIHDPKQVVPNASDDTAGVSNSDYMGIEVENGFRAWITHSDVHIDTDILNNDSGPLSKEQLANLIRHEIGHAVFGFKDLYDASVPQDLKDSTFVHDEATEREKFSDWDIKELKARFPCDEVSMKHYCTGIYSSFNLYYDVVELYVRAVDDDYSYMVYGVEILPEYQDTTWYNAEGLTAPEGWEFEQIGNGIRFYTETNPLVKCQRVKFTFRVSAERISWYIILHITDELCGNMGTVVSTRWMLYYYSVM